MPFSFFFSELFKWSFSNLMTAWPRLGRQVVRLLVLIMAQSSGLQCLGIRHIDYILTESLPDEKSFVFESPSKSGHFGCALFTDITVEKLSRIVLHRFDEKKYAKSLFANDCQVSHGLKYISVQLRVNVCLFVVYCCGNPCSP